jgi:hypothetical protein
MILEQRREPPLRLLGDATAWPFANFPGYTNKQFVIPRRNFWLLDKISITVAVTWNAIANGMLGYAHMQLLKRIRLQVFDGTTKGPRTVVDTTGMGLLFLNANEEPNLSPGTLGGLGCLNAGAIVANAVHKYRYDINLAHPKFTDTLMPAFWMPLAQHTQDPILSLDFASAAEISGVADPVAAIAVIVTPYYRVATREQAEALGPYMSGDIIETNYSPAQNITNIENKIKLNIGGTYTGMGIHMLSGAAALVPGDLSAVVTAGSESIWQLKVDGETRDYFTTHEQQSLNGVSRNADSANTLYSPNFGGALSTGSAHKGAAAVFLDFCTDGGNEVRELGSCLRTDEARQSLELVANLTTPANQASFVNVVGRRIYVPAGYGRIPAVAKAA